MSRLADRAVIRLAPQGDGEDVRGFLQGLVTNDVGLVAPGVPLWAGLLSPQGKALFDFILWDDGGGLLIDGEAAQAEALIRRLSLYRLRRRIGITAAPDLAVYWRADGDDGAPDPRLPALGRRWIGPAGAGPVEASADASAVWRAHRLALGVAEGVAELGSDATLWLECNAAELHGVSFTKGCYIGQENTARMNWRSTVNRRLAVLPIGTADPKRLRASYPDLGVEVAHMRVEDLAEFAGNPALPAWLSAAIAPARSDGAGA